MQKSMDRPMVAKFTIVSGSLPPLTWERMRGNHWSTKTLLHTCNMSPTSYPNSRSTTVYRCTIRERHGLKPIVAVEVIFGIRAARDWATTQMAHFARPKQGHA